MMKSDWASKISRIKKLSGHIRNDLALGHPVKCPCGVCIGTFMIQQTAKFLEDKLKSEGYIDALKSWSLSPAEIKATSPELGHVDLEPPAKDVPL